MAACFGFGGSNVADGFEQTPVIEPVHPFQGGEPDGFQSVQDEAGTAAPRKELTVRASRGA